MTLRYGAVHIGAQTLGGDPHGSPDADRGQFAGIEQTADGARADVQDFGGALNVE
ncbi:hypothetical protein EDC35_10427 [Thiobaca trueperi]|uniref:Uncharacterized protein n=1 Tax=Thiobaca trueperi TaxID=127458 RepID=A0A4R3MXR9_9GAMM|nr:hypothetical protein EDC35_10427 [Thiobaca trueperi]